ncbi:B2 protein-like [Miscanthus floridulus]|uniref:B2 protein-like n=1 Tax=Miscanthus floridulus TaxID=154761 RepID=UPI0034574B9E
MDASCDREFWNFSDQLRLHNNFSNLSIADSIWSSTSSPPDPSSFPGGNTNAPGLIGSAKLAFGNATTTSADRYNANDAGVGSNNAAASKTMSVNDYYLNKNANAAASKTMDVADYYYLNKNANANNDAVKSYFNKSVGRPANNNNVGGGGKKNSAAFAAHHDKKHKNSGNGNGAGVDKRFKSLPASEALPRGEAIGGYIFVCNNDTMEENLKRQLFGLPSRYRDSVRAIRPGLPLFLYNYSTHQLHGIFEAASFGGSNIDPKAWEDKKCPGESRFPAQVRVATRKICDPLEEDAFRPILHHYDGPKFRLELSVPEALSLLDIFAEKIFA